MVRARTQACLDSHSSGSDSSWGDNGSEGPVKEQTTSPGSILQTGAEKAVADDKQQKEVIEEVLHTEEEQIHHQSNQESTVNTPPRTETVSIQTPQTVADEVEFPLPTTNEDEDERPSGRMQFTALFQHEDTTKQSSEPASFCEEPLVVRGQEHSRSNVHNNKPSNSSRIKDANLPLNRHIKSAADATMAPPRALTEQEHLVQFVDKFFREFIYNNPCVNNKATIEKIMNTIKSLCVPSEWRAIMLAWFEAVHGVLSHAWDLINMKLLQSPTDHLLKLMRMKVASLLVVRAGRSCEELLRETFKILGCKIPTKILDIPGAACQIGMFFLHYAISQCNELDTSHIAWLAMAKEYLTMSKGLCEADTGLLICSNLEKKEKSQTMGCSMLEKYQHFPSQYIHRLDTSNWIK